MPTRLKRLDLHGFKSFAIPTSFVFDDGITAVIGPNGSGKSNIADALRWVLGEQSYATLRGRRTEDVIFAGGAARAPLGMAEVVVTLANDDGELPLPFQEVSVTRRAYRSGENQYLINGARMRLKDVLQLTAALGQSHTVIGQGLVDAVLSQRAEERRGLLEHAAGISGLRLKHAEAERHLAESAQHSLRLEDLLTELEPRLRALERAARQARERGSVRDELQAALSALYGWQARQTRTRLASAVAALAEAEQALAEHECARRAREQDAAQAAETLAAARAHHEEFAGAAKRLREECAGISHELALLGERRRAALARHDDLARAIEEAASGRAEAEAEDAALAARLTKLTTALAAQEQAVGVLQAEVEAARARRAEQEEALRAVTRRQAESERSRAAGEARLALLDGQSAELAAEQARLGAALAERRDSADDLVQRRDIARAAREASEAQLIALTDARGVPWAASERAHAELERLRAAERAAQRTLAGLEARHDALARLAESGAGLYAGVRAVLDASRDGALSGVVGTLAGLLRVPGELEAALEAALGAHLQDIVVERWTDAERAIEHLKRRQAGRATFQPLDTVRGLGVGRAGTGPRGAGIRGVAAELIEFDPRVEPVVAGLLGRVLVAEDLQATRAILPSLSSGWSVVTLGGEIARASGTVTGGARERQSGVLARERELRELPERRRALEAELSVIRRQANELTARSVGLIDELSRLEEQIAAETDAGRRAAGDEERAERLLADEARLVGREHARLAEIETRLGALQAEQARARTAIAEARVAAERTGAERERLASQLQTEAGSGQDDALAEARAELRALGERKRALHAERERLATRRLAAERQGAARRERLVALVQELAALEDEQARLNAAREAAAHDSRQLDGRVAAASAALQAAAAAEQAASAALARLAEEGRALERERDRLALERSRRADELELLLERAARDLDVPDAAPLLGEAEAIVDPAPLEGRIHRLRERLRRIGLVAEDAVEQYELEADRYRFLRRQLDDVRAAADALRGLMNQLEGNMDEALERTFTEVAEAFSTTFTALFGGGKARLVRVSDEDALSGLDIVAQPPGKRPQNLALLSGGERALTAVALLFAILKVNPAPFCLLDEVDAALDESNVVRVRDELRALAERTQFVVVTHNRATIEGADTLYGITMGDDGVSRTLSLRLPAEPVTG